MAVTESPFRPEQLAGKKGDSATMRTSEFDRSKTRGKEPAMENVEQRVKKIVAEHLGVDSLDTVELVMALEEEFETEIPDEEAEKITTVQQAIDYVNAHAKKT